MGRVVLALLVGGWLALGTLGCDGREPSIPTPGTIDLCGDVGDEYGCQGESEVIVPGLPYYLIGRGDDLESGVIAISLVRVTGAGERLVFTMHDYVDQGANTYANNFMVRETGRYRLEIRVKGSIWAKRDFEAARELGGREDEAEPSYEQLAADPTAHELRVECAESCEALEEAASTVRRACVDDPNSEVRRAVPASLVPAACCGFAAGAYESACSPADALKTCLDAWQASCAGG